MKPNLQHKIIIALIGTLALFGSGLSCGGGATPVPSVTLKFWKPFDSSDKWSSITSAYSQARGTNIIIEYTQKSPETYEQDLLEAMAAGAGPDIFSVRNDWLPRFRDKISPAKEDQIPVRSFKETFADIAANDLIQENSIYGIPGAIDVLAFYYNRALLASASVARPPATWPELTNMIPKLTKIAPNGSITQSAVAMGTVNNINRSPDILQLLMLQSGVEFYDPTKTNSTLSRGSSDENGESPAARSVRFYTQFADPTSRAYTWNTKQNYSIDAFAQNQAAMIFGYSYLIPLLSAKDAFLDYGITGVPQLSEGSTKVNYGSYWAETVWSGSKNTRAAWDFIQFAHSYEQNKKYVEATKQPSSRRDVLSEQQKDPTLGVFADNVLSAKSVDKPDAVQFETIINDLIEDVSLSGLKPNAAVQKAEEKIRLLLQRYPIKPKTSGF